MFERGSAEGASVGGDQNEPSRSETRNNSYALEKVFEQSNLKFDEA